MKIEQRLLPRTDLRQLQRQILSPRIIQSIHILQLATQDLEALVQQEISENPTLELTPDAPPDEPTDGLAVDPHGQSSQEESDRLERDLEFLERYNEDFSDVPQSSAASSGGADDDDPKQEALANVPARDKTLQEHVNGQLATMELDDCVRDAAKVVVQALDENGHLLISIEDIARTLDIEDALTVAEEALTVVRSLDPPGVGARNAAECLLLQIRKQDPDYKLYSDLLTRHWDDLLRNKLPKIAKETGYTIDDIKFAIEQIKTLNPYPGRDFASSAAQAVRPDIIIEERDDVPGEYRVRMVDDYLPRLRISPHYRKLLKQSGDKETTEYLKARIEGAKALIEALHQRQTTLERVANVLLKYQKDFMEVGIPGLKPLKMQKVADEVKVHVSTICRAVADKYVDTPQGTYPLRFFFTGGTETEGGDDTSRLAIKDELRKIVDAEDKSNPLSDIAIGRMLTGKLGVKIARRTVAKYRDQLSIPDSRQRKSH